MAHTQRPDLVFQRNKPVHLNWRGGLFSQLLAAEVSASAVVMVVMLDTPYSKVECKTTGYSLHSHVPPSLPLPCVTMYHQVSTELYNIFFTLLLSCILCQFPFLSDNVDNFHSDPLLQLGKTPTNRTRKLL